ncbi:hypothetical protein [Rivularia sp. UHCC 0363]|uniref:hypothetical protein n=1 Tax=Rivularia sp. UHCC 0363 TaxID=3110244 RepID=UPI002B21565D|nr:hypothetical protein [Rivularia sp. UHCC 0363]MEA5598447.1 hypothetical protein [Rivularia sp. UHCC 0363]
MQLNIGILSVVIELWTIALLKIEENLMHTIVSKPLTTLVATGTAGFLIFSFAFARAQAPVQTVFLSNKASCQQAQAKREKAGYRILQACTYAGNKFFIWNIDRGPWIFRYYIK